MESLTTLLERAKTGDRAAADRALALVYEELKRLATRQLAGERGNHTLQPTALVHEAWLRLAGNRSPYESRSHFLALAATAMRRILVHYAQARRAGKRGNGVAAVALDTDGPAAGDTGRHFDLVALDEALDRLAALDPRKVRVIELRFFAGLALEEIAESLAISLATVKRDIEMARAWLLRELSDDRA
jgi:RNA polymerase sigma factor (TIGR02999 family)